MKRVSFFLSALCSALAFCHGLKIPVKSEITDVSLMLDGALVTRQTDPFPVNAGKTTVLFKNLPGEVDPTIVQADIVVNDGVCKGLVQNSKIYQPGGREDNETVKEIQERLDDILKEFEKKKRILAEAKEDIAFTKKIREAFSEDFGKIATKGDTHALDQARALTNFVSQSHETTYSKIDSLEEELHVTRKKIKQIESEIKEAKEVAKKLSSEAEVEIEMDVAGEIAIKLTYLADSATWEPQYELKAYPDKGSLDVRYLALIQQNTGEDWPSVVLSLHTNKVLRHGNVPELSPLHIRNQEEHYYPSESQRQPSSRSKQYSMYSGSLDRNFEEDGILSELLSDDPDDELPLDPTVAITSSTVSFQATIPGHVSIPTSPDSSVYKVLDGSVEAEYWSEAVPRLELNAYLRAKIRNTLGIPILPGNAIAFVDGKLSSKVHLKNILPGEKAKVSLGVDPLVSLARKKGVLRDKNSGIYIVEKTKTLSREYKNEVTNLHQNDHRVVIVDQFPIARDEKIQIHRKEPTNESTIKIDDENNGIFQWIASLGPNEKHTFKIAYDVVYPHAWYGLSARI